MLFTACALALLCFLFCKYFFESCVSGERILKRQLRLALDKGKCVINEVMGKAVLLFVDPLHGDLLLVVCNGGEGKELQLAGVLSVNVDALESDHLAGDTGNSLLYGFLTCGKRLVDVGLGGQVSSAALEKAQLNAADLGTGAFLNDRCQKGCQTAQLCMTEAVGAGGLCLGDEGAVCIVDALGNSDKALAAVGIVLKAERFPLNVGIGLCLGMVLSAEEAGFSSALGAFVMGSILAETVESHRIEHLMRPLKDVFASIFFVSVGMMINPSSLVEYWEAIVIVCFIIVTGMIIFGTLGCWLGGQTLKDSMLTGFSYVQIGEFSFIIAGLGNQLGVTDPALYPIIVASSVITTFLTPYIMKLTIPCYNLLYAHVPAGIRNSIDERERQVEEAEALAAQATATDEPSLGDKALHAVRHTFITKRLVRLFIKNMTAKENEE